MTGLKTVRPQAQGDGGLQRSRRFGAHLRSLPNRNPWRRYRACPGRYRNGCRVQVAPVHDGSENGRDRSWRRGRRSPTRGHACSRRRQGARRCPGMASCRGSECAHCRADARRVRAPARRRRVREANAVGGERDAGRGRTARSSRTDRAREVRRRCGGVGADHADVRAGVPCRLRGAVEADDQGGARAQHAALHSAGLRQPTHRYDHGARRAELVRRTLGHAGRNGEPVAGGSVVAHEARRGPGAAPGARPEFQAAAL